MDEYRVTGVIALHHGLIVLERYANGRTAQDRWFTASVAKTVTSTLIGATIRDGLIGSIDDPITRYIPEAQVHSRIRWRYAASSDNHELWPQVQ